MRRLEWEIGVQPVLLSPEFMDELEAMTSSEAPSLLRVQLVHRDHVIPPREGMLPNSCVAIGRSAGCQLQGVYWPHRLLTFQGHPEFDRSSCRETTEAFLADDFEEDSGFRQRSLAAIDRDDDNWWTVQVIWNFFLQQSDVRPVRIDTESSTMGVQDCQKPDLDVCTAPILPVHPMRGSSKSIERKRTNQKDSQWDRPSGGSGMPQILVEA